MPFKHFTRNLWLLCFANIFAFTGTNVTIFLGGIIGSAIAPESFLATLPVALMIIGMATGSVPASVIMSRFGRRKGFMGAALFAGCSTLTGAYAISTGHFWLYGFACFAVGISVSFVQQYRFTAAESVDAEFAPQAISAILLSGIAGAFLGPNVANLTKDWITDVPFVGSYLALTVMVLMPAIILSFLKDSNHKFNKGEAKGRSIRELAQQPDFILAIMAAGLGYGIMSFIMTATPVSMHIMDGHSVYHTGVVIQWHIVGMFLPSLFTGKLIRKYGFRTIIGWGIAAFLICVGISQLDQSVAGYWFALVALGIGWNFLFITGTAMLMTCYKDNEKFRVQGINDFIVFTMQAITALSAGGMLALTNWKTINLMIVPVLLVLITVMLWSRKKNAQLSRT